jgi:hypothetical protein
MQTIKIVHKSLVGGGHIQVKILIIVSYVWLSNPVTVAAIYIAPGDYWLSFGVL